MNHSDSRPLHPIRLYHHPLSGHVHRVELFLSLLGLPFEKAPVDFGTSGTRSDSFLAMNPFGQLPVIVDGDVTLADSNSILVYLARRYDTGGTWLPVDALGAARVQRWLSVAAGELARGPALARVQAVFGRPRDPALLAASVALFGLMEAQLASQPFLAAAAPTIADVALYTYTAHSPEGGVSLEPFVNLRRWRDRIEALPGFIGMQPSPLPEPLVTSS